MKKITILALLLTVFLFGCDIVKPRCGIENCHGLDITCGSNMPQACTEIYEFGDRCRQYASCNIVDGECQLVEGIEFEECKSCIEKCLEDSQENTAEAFQCESKCIG